MSSPKMAVHGARLTVLIKVATLMSPVADIRTYHVTTQRNQAAKTHRFRENLRGGWGNGDTNSSTRTVTAPRGETSAHCCFNPADRAPSTTGDEPVGPQHQSGSSDEGKNPGCETAHRDPLDSRVNGPRGGLEALTKDEDLFVPGIEPVSSPKPFAISAAQKFTAVFV